MTEPRRMLQVVQHGTRLGRRLALPSPSLGQMSCFFSVLGRGSHSFKLSRPPGRLGALSSPRFQPPGDVAQASVAWARKPPTGTWGIILFFFFVLGWGGVAWPGFPTTQLNHVVFSVLAFRLSCPFPPAPGWPVPPPWDGATRRCCRCPPPWNPTPARTHPARPPRRPGRLPR